MLCRDVLQTIRFTVNVSEVQQCDNFILMKKTESWYFQPQASNPVSSLPCAFCTHFTTVMELRDCSVNFWITLPVTHRWHLFHHPAGHVFQKMMFQWRYKGSAPLQMWQCSCWELNHFTSKMWHSCVTAGQMGGDHSALNLQSSQSCQVSEFQKVPLEMPPGPHLASA